MNRNFNSFIISKISFKMKDYFRLFRGATTRECHDGAPRLALSSSLTLLSLQHQRKTLVVNQKQFEIIFYFKRNLTGLLSLLASADWT